MNGLIESVASRVCLLDVLCLIYRIEGDDFDPLESFKLSNVFSKDQEKSKIFLCSELRLLWQHLSPVAYSLT